MKSKKIIYWTTTVILALALASGGVAELLRVQANVDGMARLGYPVYFMMILGGWKLLGTAAILAPKFPRVKEWAYAGMFFDFTGAVISHTVCAEYGHIVAPLILAIFTIVSWALRPEDRVLGVILRDQVAA